MTDGKIRSNRVYQAFLFGGMHFLIQVASSTTLSLIMNYLFSSVSWYAFVSFRQCLETFNSFQCHHDCPFCASALILET